MLSDNSALGGDEQDQELLDAIAAAFGADAVAALGENEVVASPSLDLDATVQELDQAIYGQLPNQGQVTRSVETQQIVAFQLGETTFGMPMEHVTEIQRLPRVTNLPNVPEWLQGVANLRGHIVSVVDVRTLLGLEPSDSGNPTRRLMVVQSLVDEIDSGLIVDRVLGIRNIDPKQVHEPTSPMEDELSDYLSGVIELEERLIVLLDVEKLLLSDALRQFA
ncbi:MAG: chemotaxis protein CheW [Planctomycetales bacterium]|nr:chemotaxis protein CheW [Planctomycetales bacterium]